MYRAKHRQQPIREYPTWWTVPTMLLGMFCFVLLLGLMAFA